MEAIELGPMDVVTVVLSLFVLWLLLRTFVLGRRLKRLRKSYVQFMDGAGVENLEHIITGLQERVRDQEEKQAALEGTVRELREKLRSKQGNVGIHRYNAFSEAGGDLSFSFAIVNDKQDGMVLSGLHTRDNTYLFAKPVKQGESVYQLTEEERKALSLASQQES